jgi:hypothetical protein
VTRASSIDWPAIRLAYINGSMSMKDCAAQFDLKPGTLRQRAHREDWETQRNAMSRAVTSTAQAKIIKTKAQELSEFDAEDAKMSRALRAVAARMLVDANREGAKRLTAAEARTIASLAESAQKIGRIALGGTTENHGHGGLPGAAPITFGAALPEDVKRAMDAYLHDY